MELGAFQGVVIAVLTWAASFVGSLAATRTDIRWLRERQQSHETRLDRLAARCDTCPARRPN